jgi:hypothetical protein
MIGMVGKKGATRPERVAEEKPLASADPDDMKNIRA